MNDQMIYRNMLNLLSIVFIKIRPTSLSSLLTCVYILLLCNVLIRLQFIVSINFFLLNFDTTYNFIKLLYSYYNTISLHFFVSFKIFITFDCNIAIVLHYISFATITTLADFISVI